MMWSLGHGLIHIGNLTIILDTHTVYFCQVVKYIFISYLLAANCQALSLGNGRITYDSSPVANGGYAFDTVASFSCNGGYSRSGPSSSTCLTSGTWNQNKPNCKS